MTRSSTEAVGTENSTFEEYDTDGTTDVKSQPIWILCEATSAILALLSLYIFIALVRHMRKQNSSRLARRHRDSVMYPPKAFQRDNIQKQTDAAGTSTPPKNSDDFEVQRRTHRIPYSEQISVESTKSISNLIPTSSSGLQEYQPNVIAVQRLKERDKGVWLHRMIVVCAFVLTARCVVEQCLILLGDRSDPTCDNLTKAMVALTALSLHCCHVFLWLRQLTFYSNPVLKPLRSRKLKCFSYAAYAVMPITLAIVLALFIGWRDYESVDGVCMPSAIKLNTYLPFGVLAASTVTIQILLSSLFLYPLLIHRRKRRGSDPKLKSKQQRKESVVNSASVQTVASQKAKGDKLMACIKRVFYGATVGITTDVVGGLAGMFLPDDIPMFAYSVLYNLNVYLNVLCLIYTYANWRQMIFPWCCPSTVDRQLRSSNRRRRLSTRKERFQRNSVTNRRNEGSVKRNRSVGSVCQS